jgi:hypothetical protein
MSKQEGEPFTHKAAPPEEQANGQYGRSEGQIVQ